MGEGLTGKFHTLVKFCGGHHTGPGAGKGWELPCPRRRLSNRSGLMEVPQSSCRRGGSLGRQPEGGRAIEHLLCVRHYARHNLMESGEPASGGIIYYHPFAEGVSCGISKDEEELAGGRGQS